jgi:Ribosomal protein S3
MLGKEVALNIKEEKRPQASGQLAAENVATQLERRVAFRRAMKKVIQGALKSGAKGLKFLFPVVLAVQKWQELSGI